MRMRVILVLIDRPWPKRAWIWRKKTGWPGRACQRDRKSCSEVAFCAQECERDMVAELHTKHSPPSRASLTGTGTMRIDARELALGPGCNGIDWVMGVLRCRSFRGIRRPFPSAS